MRRLLAAVVALAMVLVSSFVHPSGWIRTTVAITVGGVERSYLVVRPAGVSSGPVLMELHGCCTTPAFELQRSGFLTVARRAILVYPAGVDGAWNAGDVAFLTAVVRRVSAGPVYLVGYSNGGRMAYRMTCERPDLFAAVAVFGAVDAQACPDQAPVSLLVAAGTADPELTVPAVDGVVMRYRAADGCAGTPVTTTEGTLTSTTWTNCGSGKRVQLSLYAGGDHAWPAGLAGVMWAFLRNP
jgi:polyhydroxybutyrate depolymerase